ncbi:MAG: hypothetical protein R2739_10100 [Chitinophagales bacterium]|nr:hypothetical protein [Bacteroidota bacterium]
MNWSTSLKNSYYWAIVLAVVVNIFSWHLPFFWDSILTSTNSQFFFEQGWNGLLLPTLFDAGHPPFFYVYITLFYFIFGKTLLAVHLAMLPITLLGIISFVALLNIFKIEKRLHVVACILFFSIPAVLTQYTLVSYDAAMLSLYLAALVAYFKQRKFLLTLFSILLVSVSLRGSIALAALSASIFFLEKQNIKSWLKWNVCFLPAIFFLIVWLIYHYVETGWLISTPSENWITQRGFADANQLVINVVSIVRCFVDVGVVVLSLLCLFYFIKYKKINSVFLICIVPFVLFSISFLPFQNPIAHRYYLIVYVLMLIPILSWLKNKSVLYGIIIACLLILGNFQIYPAPISNAWDCTMTYLSYQKCMNAFNQENKIKKTEIASVFPMMCSEQQTLLNSDSTRLIDIQGKTLDSIPYVLYSNVGNDFSDEQFHQLKKWEKLQEWKHGFVYFILYKNPTIK